MVNKNLINLVNNKKPVELVQEVDNKCQVPSFKEFMENYQDGNLNYADLNGGGISEAKGYGPTTTQRLNVCLSNGTTLYVNSHFYIILEAE